MDDSKNFITLYHHNKSIKTIKEFMDRENVYGITPEEFLSINKDLIWQQMSYFDKKVLSSENGVWPTNSIDFKISSTLPCPCILKINSDKVTLELSINQTNLQVNTADFYAFANEKIQSILQNEGYVLENFEKVNLDCRVFGWFKSLYYLGSKNNKVYRTSKQFSEFSDLSKYVYSLSTSLTENGGSFVMKLPIIDSNNLGINLIKEYFTEQNKNSEVLGNVGKVGKNIYEYNKNEYFSKTSFNSIESNYFNWLISSNDLIFISFEKLVMEQERNQKYINDNIPIESKIQNHVYDMIALVDDVKVVTNSQNSEAYVEITGRDLMKLLIEDGSFFFNPSTTSNPSQIFANDQSYGKHGDVLEADFMNNKFNNPINRIRLASGEIDALTNRQNMDIDYVIKAVISQLSNIEIVPSYVFDSWGNERTKFVELKPNK